MAGGRAPAFDLCTCGHPRRLHWLRGCEEVIVERLYPQVTWGAEGRLTDHTLPVREWGVPRYEECALSTCDCGKFERAEVSSARTGQPR